MEHVNKGFLDVTIRFLLGFLLFLLSLPIHAVQLEGLYSAEVSVVDQSQSARNEAIGLALKKVVQKVSGRRSALNNKPLLAALSNVGAYVEQFQYKKRASKEGYWLIVRFQKAALDRTLRQFDVPIWGANRPDVLLWLAVDDGKKRFIINESSSAELGSILKQEINEAGLAITLPLLDLSDQRKISFNDVWATFSDEVRRASTRYGVKQIMVGQLLKSRQGWRFSWTLMGAEGQKSGFEESANKGAVLQQAFVQIAEVLADIYAPKGALMLDVPIKMEVRGLRDLKQFIHITSYLSALDMVKKLSWTQLKNNEAVLDLMISGEVRVLKDIIALNEVLVEDVPLNTIEPSVVMGPDVAVQALEPTLYYRAR